MKLIIDIPEKDLEFIKDLQFIGGFRGSTKTIQGNVINAIRNGTPYEERPQGEWSEVFEHLGEKYHKCSECCFGIKLADYDNFCPNCGADMRKGGAKND